MNEQLQSKLVEIMTSIQSAASAAGDFAMTQLPDIAQSYVMYGRAIHTTYLLIGIVMIGVLLWLLPRASKAMDDGGVWPIPVYMFGVTAAAICVLNNLGSTMLVWFAPKVWLLKELAGMVK